MEGISSSASMETEMGADAVGGSFFADSRSRHGDLTDMLDGNKDAVKVEAMKRIINMMAKGRDVGDLFPAIVKNVAAKDVELKKLVYVYLVRYAEEQQDLALLSISTFQRALKDPNQLIRASALRVLSSIRVPMIAPILMLCIKESTHDMSPYVRKVSAHAIPKLYALEPELKEQLVEVLDFLLADKTTLVVGSAVYAFTEVCPERVDLLHKHYRKLCTVLMDVDEWGQAIIINTLTRYARAHFIDANEHEGDDVDVAEKSEFYSDEDDQESTTDHSDDEESKASEPPAYEMEPDLRLLLRSTKALLQSRNSAVVVAVAQLYYHLAPRNEMGIIARALIRLLRSHREVQSIVLVNIATISAKRRVYANIYAISKNVFEPFLKSFFVRSSDPTHIKLLKLEILTNLATQTNISIILREFQQYVHTNDSELAAAAIDAIGRCAANIDEVTDVCLSGLVTLMASRNEMVVAQSVVVIKRLLQLQPSAHVDIIVNMSKLIDTIRVPVARASIVALMGEYCEMVSHIAPDVLRKMAKTFAHEDVMVKLQVLNLAVRCLLTNAEQTALLAQYVATLAKYDTSYDVRDRARLLRNLVIDTAPSADPSTAKTNRLSEFAADIFLAAKPLPLVESVFKDRDQFQLGTLSHYLNERCAGYQDLPDFPIEKTDTSVRDVEGYGVPTADDLHTPVISGSSSFAKHADTHYNGTSKAFYSESESGSNSGSSSSESGSESGSEASSEGTDDSSSDSGTSDESSDTEEEVVTRRPTNGRATKPPSAVKTTARKPAPRSVAKATTKKSAKNESGNLLLDLDFGGDNDTPSSGATAPPGMATALDLAPLATALPVVTKQPTTSDSVTSLPSAPAQHVPARRVPLLERVVADGLSIHARYTRMTSAYSQAATSCELQMANEGKVDVDVHFEDIKCESGMSAFGLDGTHHLPVGGSTSFSMAIDFADTTQPMTLTAVVVIGDVSRRHRLSLTAPVGEQLHPLLLTEAQFKQVHARLSGMNETSGKMTLGDGVTMDDEKAMNARVYDVANVLAIGHTPDKAMYAGRTNSSRSAVLVTVTSIGDVVKLAVNTDNMVVGSMLFKLLKAALAQ